MNEGSGIMPTMKKEGRKNYRRLTNKLKRTTDMAKGIS
jgi:hypothetical protein